jgi:hypothetical protein
MPDYLAQSLSGALPARNAGYRGRRPRPFLRLYRTGSTAARTAKCRCAARLLWRKRVVGRSAKSAADGLDHGTADNTSTVVNVRLRQEATVAKASAGAAPVSASVVIDSPGLSFKKRKC